VITVADTSGIIALFNRADVEHRQTTNAANACGLLVISALTITEVHQVASIRANRSVADSVIDTLAARADTTRLAIADTTPAILHTAVAIRRQYAHLDLDFADAVNVAVAAEFRTNIILTLDRRDIRFLRPLTPHESFQLLPDDLQTPHHKMACVSRPTTASADDLNREMWECRSGYIWPNCCRRSIRVRRYCGHRLGTIA